MNERRDFFVSAEVGNEASSRALDDERLFGSVIRFLNLGNNRTFSNYEGTIGDIRECCKALAVMYRSLPWQEAKARLVMEESLRSELGESDVLDDQGMLSALHLCIDFLEKWERNGQYAPIGIGRNPERMTLQECLVLVSEQPQRFALLYETIFSNKTVRQAEENNLCWVIPGAHPWERIDVSATLRRVHLLSKGPVAIGVNPLPTTIEGALGFRERSLVAPHGGAIEGRDPHTGIHYGELPALTARAMHWAVQEGVIPDLSAASRALDNMLRGQQSDQDVERLNAIVQLYLEAGKPLPYGRFHPDALLPNAATYPQPLDT